MPALRWFVLLVALGFFTESMARQPAPAGDKPVILVGVLTEQWVRICTADQDERWIDKHYEAGFVRLVPGRGVDLESHLGQVVRIRGSVPDGISFPHPGHEGECPPMQARMDWVFGKNGIRLFRARRQGSLSAAVFSAEQVERFRGLSAKRSGSQVEVSFTNTLKDELPDVEITLHYEGCYGKPGAPTKTKKLGTLKPGQTGSARFPAVHSMEMQGRLEGIQHHVLHSIQVTTLSRRVIFDLDWSPDSIRIRCPDRRGRK